MREWIFFSPDGTTQDKNGVCIDNCQVLGRGRGETFEAAQDDFMLSNPEVLGRRYTRVIHTEVFLPEDDDKKNPMAADIISDYLRRHGYDGLFSPEARCGCLIDDIAPCGEDCTTCKAANRQPRPADACDCESHFVTTQGEPWFDCGH